MFIQGCPGEMKFQLTIILERDIIKLNINTRYYIK